MANLQILAHDASSSSGMTPPQPPAHTESANHENLEHFIPLRKAELIDRLCHEANLSPSDANSFRQLCQLLDATLHFQYHAHFEDLQNAYAPFDGDCDTQSL